MELRPAPGLVDQGAVGAADGEVLDHALDVVVGTVGDGEVPGHRDADDAAGVVGDQGRVLEPVDLPHRHPAIAGPVVDMDQFGPGLPVEDLESRRGGHDHILVAVPAQIGRRHRADDRADRRHPPDHGAVAGVEGPHRSGATSLIGAFDEGELPVPPYVGQGGAPTGGAVERVAPDLIAPRVEHLDGVLVAPRVEGAGARGDAECTTGKDRAHRGRGVDLFVRVGGADQAAMVVEDAQVAPVLVLAAVGHAGRGCTADDDLVLPGAIEIADGRRGEHAVGREEGPPTETGAVRRTQRVGFLPQGSGHDERDTGDGTHRRRGLHAGIGNDIGRRVGGDLVPRQRAAGAVGVIAAHGGIGGVPGVEVHLAARRRRHHRCGGVDRRVARHADAVGPDRGRCGGTVVPGDVTRLAGSDAGRRRRARPARGHRAVGEMERVQRTGSITHLHRGTSLVEGDLDGRGLGHAARCVVQEVDPVLCQGQGRCRLRRWTERRGTGRNQQGNHRDGRGAGHHVQRVEHPPAFHRELPRAPMTA